jgi:hypothetical protein
MRWGVRRGKLGRVRYKKISDVEMRWEEAFGKRRKMKLKNRGSNAKEMGNHSKKRGSKVEK